MQTEGQAHHSMASGDIVELNVGGSVFTTTFATLTSRSDSLFSRMFSSPLGVQRDRKGRIFIDRSGALFAYVLDFLRTGQFLSLPSHLRRAVEEEMLFYSIPLEESDTVISDSVLASLVASVAQQHHDLANPVLQRPDLSEHMAQLVLVDLLHLAQRGLLRTGLGNVVFVCTSLSSRLIVPHFVHHLPSSLQNPDDLAAAAEKAADMLVSKQEVNHLLPPEVRRFYVPPPELTKTPTLSSSPSSSSSSAMITALASPAQSDIVFEVVRGVDCALFFSICEHLKKYLIKEKKVTLHLSCVNREVTLNPHTVRALKGPSDLIFYLPFARFTWNYW